jgi:hypothetical protein
MSMGSMLPPDSTATIGPSDFTAPVIIAATATAPAGSTTSFARSSSTSRARAMSSSDTVTTSSIVSRMIAKLSSPGRYTAMPSAMVGTTGTWRGSPAASDAM